MSEDKIFGGFVPPTRNWFHMPNVWIDICAEIDNLSELKVIQYVLRHTWGYQEYDSTPKTITTDEFMYGRKYTQGKHKGERIDKGTGLSNHSVIEGLRRAVKHGYLVCTVDESDKARIIKAYALKRVDSGLDLHSRCEDSSHQSDMQDLHTGCEESSHPIDMKILHTRYADSSQRSEKEKRERHRKTREKEREPSPSNLDPFDRGKGEASLSLSPSHSFLSSLTEEQTTFWTRWCAISKSQYASLNQTGYKHVVELAEKGLTTEELQSLYDTAYDRIREFSASTGKPAVPPRLGNLVKALPEWEQKRALKKKDQEQEQTQHEHLPGSGHMRNFTRERHDDKAKPVTSAPLPQEQKSTLPAGISPSQMLEELRARRRMQKEGT